MIFYLEQCLHTRILEGRPVENDSSLFVYLSNEFCSDHQAVHTISQRARFVVSSFSIPKQIDLNSIRGQYDVKCLYPKPKLLAFKPFVMDKQR